MKISENFGWRRVHITVALTGLVGFLAVGSSHTGLAQDGKIQSRQGSVPTVTAAATTARVRFTAPASITRIQLQVFGESGEMLFDVSSKGNVLDWTLQDGAGQHLGNGSYLCVVTVKSLSGRLSQKIGSISVEEKQAELRQVDAAQMTAGQQLTVGPIEESGALTILKAGETEATTLVAHDGTQGDISRSRGPLSFRLGDFFSGNDEEQMRLTEEGNLGIGTDSPQAKLDVAGVIRTSKGVEFENGTRLTTTVTGALQQTLVDGTVLPNVAGTGTQNKIAKWTDNSGTLGDSVVTELNGNIGIGTTSPASLLHLAGPSGVSAITLNTPGNQRFRFQTVPAIPNWGALTLNANYNAGWFLDDPATNGWFFKLDTRGGNADGPNNGLWLFKIPPGANPHTDEGPVFGVSSSQAFFAGNVGIGTTSPTAKLDVAGNVNTSTQYNIGGDRVLSKPGTNNLFAGIGAGQGNSTGSGNSFFGSGAGQSNSTGSGNSFFGSGAGTSNLLGSGNAFFGQVAGFGNTMGTNNSFYGAFTGNSNTEGNRNSFFGSGAGLRNTTGNHNSFFGTDAGNGNTGGSRNIFIGAFSGSLNTNETNNTFIGYGADGALGVTNATAIGSNAQVRQNDSLVLGSINTVNNATADTKVGIGTTAPGAKLHVAAAGQAQFDLQDTVPGGTPAGGSRWRIFADNVGGGADNLTFGFYDVTNGAVRLGVDNSGNVGIGTSLPAEKLHVSGGNVRWANSQLIAEQGGSLELGGTSSVEGTGTPYIDFHFGPVGGAQDFNTRIINDADGRLTVFGSLRVDTLGAGTTALCLDANNIISNCVSSIRFKDHVLTLRSGLDVVRKLRPVTFHWKADGKKDLGLVAEEVNEVEPLLVTHTKAGEVEGVKYDRVAVVLLNAVREQQQTIEQLKQQNATLKLRSAKQEALLAALETRVNGLSQHNGRQRKHR